MRFKIDWASQRASLIVRSKFTIFALFYLVCEGNFPSTSPGGGGGALYLDGQFNEGFFALPVWGAYIWTSLFLEFYGITLPLNCNMTDNLSPTVSVRHMGPSLPYDSHERYRPSVCKGAVNAVSSRNVHVA